MFVEELKGVIVFEGSWLLDMKDNGGDCGVGWSGGANGNFSV